MQLRRSRCRKKRLSQSESNSHCGGAVQPGARAAGAVGGLSGALVEWKAEPLRQSARPEDHLCCLAAPQRSWHSKGSSDSYILTPSSVVGAVHLPDLAVTIRPKIPIDRVLFLVSYALEPTAWKKLGFLFEESDSLVEWNCVLITFTRLRHSASSKTVENAPS
jgi:hypothetical protein